ncbi:mitochondrial elongation factor MEF2 KNAG_0B01730 [Huiozyma naganishii CBS 8797]|uniref:Ribosome-releasing factor 2, mitochondrial n=1 Tax=Huiozyma naganishii (strain ATCC MYA-139 / BCRC 22969 / CBS 8797 / KCTC 17520 / NBRC 10181 / NCYC 3082 / Yp74L-3) TaxID=1071383 RepID=J7S4J8_HUIN7|nr:hypothetical protein KNAG_0B01730 [Kazachstania naganishii CBS 8797]CCK68616.1 hypothetical protein KNAG_0B01730 [Kazachstania naganishii CBS 8797]
MTMPLLFPICRRLFSSVAKMRNIGIIAHIDAGKTTTTERLLYYAGKINRIGDVDTGDTITDYLPQERARGVTIQSAAVSFDWQGKCRINLIDTPGHADFSFEVIRALKVLDGCVTILDAVAGVESQTEKVWKMSNGIPKICFINKMDRVGAGFSRTLKEIITRLNTRVAVINIPYFQEMENNKSNEPKFEGVIDIIDKKLLKWDNEDADQVIIKDMTEMTTSSIYNDFLKSRETLIETLSEFDEDLVEHFLNEADGDYLAVSPTVIHQSIKKLSLSNVVTPVLCGSSFRKIGVQPLLDAVASYLPSPLEARLPELNNKDLPIKRDPRQGLIINNSKNLTVALAFKVISDPVRGTMVFVRVYSGILRSGNTVFNSTMGSKFKIGKLVLMNGNVPEEINVLRAGEIGVLTGATIVGKVFTSDTIISHSIKKDGIKAFDQKKELTLQVNPLVIPPPVFSMVVEPKSLGNKEHMEASLQRLIIEDPSLHISKDFETGETLLSGMGELHLEIAGDKLLNDMAAEVSLGKMTVSFKETIDDCTAWATHDDGKGYKMSLQVCSIHKLPEKVSPTVLTELEHETWVPLRNDDNYLVVENNERYNSNGVWEPLMSYQSIINALSSSALAILQRGGKIANFPLYSCVVRVKGDWEVPIDVEKPSEVLTISKNLIMKAIRKLEKDKFSLLEPIMSVAVTVTANDLGKVSQDLTGSRNATIVSIENSLMADKDSEGSLKFQSIAEAQYFPKDTTLKMAQLKNRTFDMKHILAEAPLHGMISYNKKLRSLTQGRGEFDMEYHGMSKVNKSREEELLQKA